MNYNMIIYILGNLMKVEGCIMVVPLFISIAKTENAPMRAFITTIIMLFILGTILTSIKFKNKDIYAREGFVITALSWIVLSFFGAMPFYFSETIPSFIDSFFETVSGFTTTGASILTEIEGLPLSILFWRSFTHWIGGMGVLVFLLAIIPMGGDRSMYIMKAEAPGPLVGKLVPKVKSTAKLLYLIYVFLTIAEILFLIAGGMPLFDSIVSAFSTAGTGGYSIKNTSIAAYNSAYIEYTIAIFMMIFGINFNLFYLLLMKDFINIFKNEELRYYLGIIAVATILITANIASMYDSIEQAFRNAFFQVTALITTTGFVTANFELWPEFSKTILIVIVMIGACGGSTGGGLKVSRLVIVLKMITQELKRMVHPRSINIIKLDGMKIEQETVDSVTSFFVIYVFLIFGSFIIISVDNFDFTTSLTAVMTCVGNVGPGLGGVGPVENFSIFSPFVKMVLCMDMLLGRLEIFPLVMLFSPAVWKKGFM
ncbi:MAG: TrkH family potassium uptake protein [Firmicutes bacterium]|nr:TrkH family potassium uptake protein [Bacillota bacterium]